MFKRVYLVYFMIILAQGNLQELYESISDKIELKGNLPTMRPCECSANIPECSCCNGNVISFFGINLKQHYCWGILARPDEFAVDLYVVQKPDNKDLIRRTIGGHNPKPLCLPNPNPLPGARKLCARLFNMNMIDGQIHACLRIEYQRFDDITPLLDFECIQCSRKKCTRLATNTTTPSTIPDTVNKSESTTIEEVHEEAIGNSNKNLSATKIAESNANINDSTENRAITYPCRCNEGICSCCTGNVLQNFNVTMRNRVCAKLRYDPDDFMIDMRLTFNDKTFLERRISGKNPPPVCLPIPYLSALRVCARFSNVYLIGRNIHTCVSLETQWNRETALAMNFDCIRLGANGVAIVKPEDGGGLPQPVPIAGSGGDDGIGDYDENIGGTTFSSSTSAPSKLTTTIATN